jgi:cytidylate kinase
MHPYGHLFNQSQAGTINCGTGCAFNNYTFENPNQIRPMIHGTATGTNAVTASVTFSTGGGIVLTTAGASADSVIVLPHLDTGLLYRAVGLAVLDAGGDLGDAETAAKAARALDLASLSDNPRLTDRGAGEAASRVASHPGVRAALLKLQQDFAAQAGGAVLDGRDIGTVIAPGAPAKLYITASPEVRAERRWKQLTARGEVIALDDMLDDIRRRDARDAGRDDAPMVQADNAVLLDTTDLGIEAAFDAARRIVEAARARAGI